MNHLLSNDQILTSYPPDIIFSVAKVLPYQDILKLCKVSKRFNDLFRVKNYNNLWKYLYLRDISMVPLASGTDYYNLYRTIQQNIRGLSPDGLLGYGSRNGLIHLVQKSLEEGANYYNWGLASAALGGNMGIVKLMLNLGANEYNWALANASYEGNMDIVKLMLGLGANHYNDALSWASRSGHMDIVKLMLNSGANNYNGALTMASVGGHLDIVKLMLSLGATDYDGALAEASGEGHFNIMEYIKEYRDSHT